MTKSTYTTLLNEAKDIEAKSGGFVVLAKENQDKRYGKWMLFVDGQYCSTMRAAHAMAFLDGWKLAEVASNVQNKTVLLRVEDTKPL